MTQHLKGSAKIYPDGLKLHAEDHEDLHIISAHMQDALIPVSSLMFHQDLQRFHLTANRFRWEIEDEAHQGAPLYYRTHTQLSFGHVNHVRHQGFDMTHPTHILSLLAIRGQTDGTVVFQCSEGAVIHLHTHKVLCRLCDVGDHWPTMQTQPFLENRLLS